MNDTKTTVQGQMYQPKHGDILVDPSDGDLYILAQTEANRCAAIRLADGNRHRDPSSDPRYAVGNLRFLGRDLTITIS